MKDGLASWQGFVMDVEWTIRMAPACGFQEIRAFRPKQNLLVKGPE